MNKVPSVSNGLVEKFAAERQYLRVFLDLVQKGSKHQVQIVHEILAPKHKLHQSRVLDIYQK